MGFVIRINYFLFRGVFKNRKYDLIRPSDVFISLPVTSIVLFIGALFVLHALFFSPLLSPIVLKTVAGVIVALFVEKYALILLFNQMLKEALKEENTPKTKRICTKEHPFVPPLKDDEVWEHKDAYDKFPEHEFSTVIYHCPNCGIDIPVDMS